MYAPREYTPGEYTGRMAAWQWAGRAACGAGWSAPPGGGALSVPRQLGNRRFVDALNGLVERAVERFVALLRAQPFGERAREAGDDAGVAREPRVCFLAAVATGERDDAEHARMLEELAVEVIRFGQGELEHDDLVVGDVAQPFPQMLPQQLLGLGFVGAVDVDFRFQDRHESGRQNLPPK